MRDTSSLPLDLLSSSRRNEKITHQKEQVEYHIREILRLIGEDPMREGLLNTPQRVRKMYEEIFAGYTLDAHDILGVTFDEQHEELVVVKDIVFYSQCEHHMAPFFGKIHIGYIPSGKIAGLSKFARLVDAITRRLQVQERVTSQIADVIETVLQPHGTMVIVEAEHLCMCARGIKKFGSTTVTTATRGQYRQDATLRAEMLSFIGKK